MGNQHLDLRIAEQSPDSPNILQCEFLVHVDAPKAPIDIESPEEYP
jgi:hypothetical protein